MLLWFQEYFSVLFQWLSYEQLLTGDNGIKSIQLTLLGNNGFTAPIIFGRPIENLGKWNEKVYPQRRLFIDNLKMPVADSLTKPSKPLTTYLLTNGIPAINGQYDNWLKRKQGQSNQEIKKNYEGYLNTDRKLTQATNPNNLTIKDVALNYKGNKVIKDFDVRANCYFKYNVDIGYNTINPSKNRGQLKDMLNLFSVMVNHIISLPIDVTESIAWTQRDIPIVGKFLNAISLGIPIYWKTIDNNTNNLYPNIKQEFLYLLVKQIIHFMMKVIDLLLKIVLGHKQKIKAIFP